MASQLFGLHLTTEWTQIANVQIKVGSSVSSKHVESASWSNVMCFINWNDANQNMPRGIRIVYNGSYYMGNNINKHGFIQYSFVDPRK